MYRRPSKRQKIRRVLIYALMVTSVISITGIVLLLVLGFRLDSENGLEQGALLQFDSDPNGATVMIDGKTLATRTPNKSTVLAGQHEIVMTRDGYRPWQKQVNLVAGTLTWLDYGILIPNKLELSSVATFPTLAKVLISEVNEQIIVQPDTAKPELKRFNIRNDKPEPVDLVIPEDAYTESDSHTFALTQITMDGRYALVHHVYKDGNEWLVVDTEDVKRTKNATTLLNGIALSDVRFIGNGNNNLYGLSDGALRKMDLNDKTVSPALVKNVTNFKINNGVVVFMAKVDNNETAIGIYHDGDEQPVILRQLPNGQNAFVAIDTYVNDTYVAISTDNKTEILKGSLPRTAAELTRMRSVVVMTTDKPVISLSFSLNGQYALAQTETQFTSYDLEHDRRYTVETEGGTIGWLNKATIYVTHKNKLIMREFDGANYNSINDALDGYPATLTSNGRYLYSIGKTDDNKYQLQRVRLILQ